MDIQVFQLSELEHVKYLAQLVNNQVEQYVQDRLNNYLKSNLLLNKNELI